MEVKLANRLGHGVKVAMIDGVSVLRVGKGVNVISQCTAAQQDPGRRDVALNEVWGEDGPCFVWMMQWKDKWLVHQLRQGERLQDTRPIEQVRDVQPDSTNHIAAYNAAVRTGRAIPWPASIPVDTYKMPQKPQKTLLLIVPDGYTDNTPHIDLLMNGNSGGLTFVWPKGMQDTVVKYRTPDPEAPAMDGLRY